MGKAKLNLTSNSRCEHGWADGGRRQFEVRQITSPDRTIVQDRDIPRRRGILPINTAIYG